MYLVVAACFVIAGAVEWRARPRGRIGPLLVIVGLLWTVAKVPWPLPWPVTWPLPWPVMWPVTWPVPPPAAVGGAWAAVLAHLLLAFPSGRLGSLGPRLIVGIAYGAVGLVALRPGAGSAIAGVVVVGTAVAGMQVFRWYRSSPARRRTVNPVLGAAIVAVTMFVAVKPAAIANVDVSGLMPVMQGALAAVPLGFLVRRVRLGLDRGGVAGLLVRLNDSELLRLGVGEVPQRLGVGEVPQRLGVGEVPPRVGIVEPQPRPGGELEAALAKTLHDPGLRVGFWAADKGTYVDASGQALPPPREPDQVATRVDRHGRPLAMLLHDRALLEDRDLIEGACAAMALTLELAGSRDRILRATEAERRRIERDLHDGVQQRLLSIPMTLSLAESKLAAQPERAESLIREAKSVTLAVLGELRALSQGIHPPLLTERGLYGALSELAQLSPVPVEIKIEAEQDIAAQVESAVYFVVAEALANVAKHAAAARARVRVGRSGERIWVEVCDDGRGGAVPSEGSGLHGLAERVAALGGTLRIDSPSGGGTLIRAEVPCG
ncbi:MAG TPA: histidine kinase [Candidatus Limnocylindrales bacterium]